MRYIASDERPIEGAHVRAAFAAEEEDYVVEGSATELAVSYEASTIARVTINAPGDGLFETELAELIETVEAVEGPSQPRVLETLRSARSVLAVQVVFGEGDIDDTLDAISPLWTWLQDNRRGLLQADGEGYYDAEGLILELD